MRVVSDADVIIHLAKLKQLKLLKQLYESVCIPRYVELETIRCQYDEIEFIEDAIRQEILKVYETDDSRARSIAEKYNIHIGEAHVKVLAKEIRADIFLSNEKKVRIVAKKEGFSVVGSIGVILRGTKQSYLTGEAAIKLLNKIKSSEFRIHPDIVNRAINSLRN